MIQQNPQDAGQAKDPFYYPYQRYLFSRDGVMKHLTSLTPISDSQKKTQQEAPSVSFYTLKSGGSVVVRRKDSPRLQHFLCTAITQDATSSDLPLKAGDLLISYYKTQSQPPVLQRVLRREPSMDKAQTKK